jgi:hypothetical protein
MGIGTIARGILRKVVKKYSMHASKPVANMASYVISSEFDFGDS